eukprot:1160129-Pelagomonas_calceolata.AAC.4
MAHGVVDHAIHELHARRMKSSTMPSAARMNNNFMLQAQGIKLLIMPSRSCMHLYAVSKNMKNPGNIDTARSRSVQAHASWSCTRGAHA